MIDKKILIFIVCLFSAKVGYCYNKYQCNEITKTLYGYGWLYKTIGMITQLNECALMDGLKIETGGYYQAKKLLINSDVQKGGGSNLDKLGQFIGCDDSSLPDFAKSVVANKEFIFGKDFDEYQPRTVMLNIYEIIEKDYKLKAACKR